MDPRGIEPLSPPCHGDILPVYYGPVLGTNEGFPQRFSSNVLRRIRIVRHTVATNNTFLIIPSHEANAIVVQLLEEGGRINRRPVSPHLKMQMRSGGSSRRPHLSYHLPSAYFVSRLYIDFDHVPVEGR